MSRKNATEYDRDWQDMEHVIREARAKLDTIKPLRDEAHKAMHRQIYLCLRKAELYCELSRAKELLEKQT